MKRRIGLARARRRLERAEFRLATVQELYDARMGSRSLHNEAFAKLAMIALYAEVQDAKEALARLER